MSRRGTSSTYVRRSDFLIAYLVGDEVALHNYACRTAYQGHPRVLRLMARAGAWTAVQTLLDGVVGWDGESPRELVDTLIDRRILHTLDHEPPAEESQMERWRGWNPAAGFLHLSTKDVSYVPRHQERRLRFVPTPEPAPLKEYPDTQQVRLPPFPRDSSVGELLLGRRTWRRFGSGSLDSEELSAVLGLTWAVQGWVAYDGVGPQALKTSPSGGARHSLEAYVIALDVSDIPRGTYHYHPDRHVLELLSDGFESRMLEIMLPQQSCFHRPSALVFMTSVFARVRWRYGFPRAYRVLHLEAGHFGQTFCLVATSLGLAPFTTAALGDSAIERHLGIDGIGESVLYALGVGRRPEGERWAPDPDREVPPPVRAPAWLARADEDPSAALDP